MSPQSQFQNPKSKIPSSRDLEIYNRIRIQNHLRWEVAHDHGLHQTRISQIVRRVERYFASGGSPTHPQITDQQGQHRLAHALHKLRLLRALEIASAYLETPDDPVQKSRRRLVAGQEVWREEFTAENRGTRQIALQNYIATVKALAALERSETTHDTPTAASPHVLQSPIRNPKSQIPSPSPQPSPSSSTSSAAFASKPKPTAMSNRPRTLRPWSSPPSPNSSVQAPSSIATTALESTPRPRPALTSLTR